MYSTCLSCNNSLHAYDLYCTCTVHVCLVIIHDFHFVSVSFLGNNKKTKDTSSHWGSSHVGHTDNAWCHTPETDMPTSSIGRKVKHQGHHNNPWGNVPQDSNWTSEDELANSDPLAEEVLNNRDMDRFTIDKRDGGSDFEELEIEGLPTPSDNPFGQHPGGRLRNDSDAMKDGVSSNTHIKDLQDEPLEGSLWRGHISRSSMGSSSSVNSAGSNSSWKGVNNGASRSSNNNGNGNNYQRSASPRKHSRYENHRSLSTSGKTMLKYPPRPKPKQVVDLDDGVDLLQCEPSGWGDLPSPKPSDVDTGTDVWGIPDDIKRKMKKDPKQGNGMVWGGRLDKLLFVYSCSYVGRKITYMYTLTRVQIHVHMLLPFIM